MYNTLVLMVFLTCCMPGGAYQEYIEKPQTRIQSSLCNTDVTTMVPLPLRIPLQTMEKVRMRREGHGV
jgi:hypothetical protein